MNTMNMHLKSLERKQALLFCAVIQGWISGFKEKPNVLLSAINDAKKITDYIENKGELSEIVEKQKCVIQGRKR